MAFTRSFLESVGLNKEQVSAVMEEHVAVTDGLKKDRDTYKAEAEKVPDLEEKVKAQADNEDYKTKYEQEHTAFESYKAKVAQEAESAKVSAAYRKLLTEEKISEKRLDAILRVTDLSAMKLTKDGKLEGEAKLRESIKTDWAEFITKKEERGAGVDNPPDHDNTTFETMSLAEKMQYANAHPSDAAVTAWLNK